MVIEHAHNTKIRTGGPVGPCPWENSVPLRPRWSTQLEQPRLYKEILSTSPPKRKSKVDLLKNFVTYILL